MKKVLSLVLALAMILGSVSMVFAVAEDVEGTKYESAVTTLVGLGVINGYTDGSFKPEKNITRAEFCKVVIKSLGLDYDGSTANTVFSDVPSTHWASGYVEAAYELGIVNGRSATIFDPEANVSYNEAIAMVVRALGYEDSHLIGSYPTAHISKAKGLGILGDVQVGSAAAPRGDVAQLVYNALDAKFVVYKGDDGTETATQDSMLKRLTGATNKTKAATVFKDDDTVDCDPDATTTKLSVAKGTNLKSYLGAYVTYYLNEDKDTITAIKEVKSSFLTGQFKSATKFKDSDDNEYTIDGAAATTVDYFKNGEYNGTKAYATDTTYKVAVKLSGKTIKEVYSFQEWAVDDDFMFDESFEDDQLNGHKFVMDDNDKIDTTSFELLGADSVDKIAKDSVVYVYLGSKSGKVTKVEVGTKTVDGKITKTNAAGDKFTIGSETFKQSAVSPDAKYKLSDEGTFYLDYAGKLYKLEGKASDDLFGYAIEAQNGASSVFNSKGTQVQIFKADGTKEIFDASKHAKTSDKWNEPTLNGGTTCYIPVVYTLNTAGDIYDVTEMKNVSAADYDYVGATLDVSKKGVIASGGNSYKLTSDTVIIVVEDSTLKPDEAKVVKASALYDTKSVNMEFIAKNGAIKFCYVDGKVTSGSDDYILFNGYTIGLDGDDEILDISAFVNGKETSYTAVKGNVDTEAQAANDMKIYTVTFDGQDIATAKAVVKDSDHEVTALTVAATDKAEVKDGVLVATISGTEKSYVLSSSVVIYKWNADDKVWALGKTADLKDTATGKGYAATLYDVNVDGEYDYVALVKN